MTIRSSRFSSRSFRLGLFAAVVLFAISARPWTLFAQGPQPAKGVRFAQVSPADLKEWLTYLASDDLRGRQIYTEGYGMAAQFIAQHLKDWGVKPVNGSYFQPVRTRGYRVTRNSSVTLALPTGPKTFKHGDHVTFSVNSGGKQTVNYSGVEFVGYGAAADLQGRDLKDKLVVFVPNAAPAPAAGVAPGAAGGRGAGGGRGAAGGRGGPAGAIALGAKGAITFAAAPAPLSPADQALLRAQAALLQATEAVQAARRGSARGAAPAMTQAQIDVLTAAGLTPAQIATLNPAPAGRGRGQTLPAADVTSLLRVDNPVTPQFTADETFFDALFSAGPVTFADVRAKASRGEPIAPMTLPVRVSVTIDNTFDIVSEQVSQNVVGIVPGTEAALKDTYVLFGAHLDHVGYSQTGGGSQPTPASCRARSATSVDALEAAGKKAQNPRSLSTAAQAAGRGGARAGGGGAAGRGAAAPGAAGRGAPPANTTPFDQRDVISNGADDDGSGSIALMGIAKAFATGAKPKRSLVFVWHTGEESGLNGSRYNADFPIVPLDKVQAALNMDMVGRDDCDNIEGDYSNSVFVVGADRISTDLHNLIVQTNGTQMAKPLALDYELNDANDPEGVYTRSDHYSYAAKGIPVAFFTTGLHADYHKVSDTADKITYPKMARIAQLVYQTGFAIANTDQPLQRDNKGPRTGFGTKPEVIKK